MVDSDYIHIFPKGKVSNGTWGWRNKGRPGFGPGMLLGGVGLKRKPYLDDRGKDAKSHRGSRDNRVGGRRIDKGNQGKDESSYFNEGENYSFFERKPRHLCMEP